MKCGVFFPGLLLTVHLLCAAVCLGQQNLQASLDDPSTQPSKNQKVIKILPIGDSITQGSTAETCYRFPLWQKLHANGYFAEYVGGRESSTRIGVIRHEGWSGHTVEFFAKNIEDFYKKDMADIVLLHSGHNHDVAEKPIPSIIESTEKIISTVRRLNPNAIVFVAQVITSGKLPKYSYIPELNLELEKLVLRIDPKQEHVKLVDQSKNWDYKTDCVPDMVHPNAVGAAKMAQCWYEALVEVLPPPGQLLEPQLIEYKKKSGRSLQLHVFNSDTEQKNKPVVVYFFGGGWSLGTPLQFYAECRELAAKNLVGISVDYRISSIDRSTPFDSLTDAKSAIRWIRSHSDQLGIDPNRIAAAGSSAGGHLAAATAMCSGFDDPADDLNLSAIPNALILLAPVINNGPEGFGYDQVKERYQEFSPYHALKTKAPPVSIFIGEHDKATSPVIKDFQSRIQQLGGRCDLHIFPGLQHGLFAYREPPDKVCLQIRTEVVTFLKSIGYID